jgi:hypothetical protein
MDNKKKMADMAAEIVGNILGAKTEEKLPENAVRLEMTPGKISAYAKLFPREMVEKSVGTFIASMVMQFYGWDGKGEPELMKRSEAGDEQAERITKVIGLLADMIAHDLKGEQYNWDDEE